MRGNANAILIELVISYLITLSQWLYKASIQAIKLLNQYVQKGKVELNSTSNKKRVRKLPPPEALTDNIYDIPAIVRLRHINLKDWFERNTQPEPLKRLEYKPL